MSAEPAPALTVEQARALAQKAANVYGAHCALPISPIPTVTVGAWQDVLAALDVLADLARQREAELDRLREALREKVILPVSRRRGRDILRCFCCRSEWVSGDPEQHDEDCPARPRGERKQP